VTDTKKLDGKVAIVTGAGTDGEGIGIGKAISVVLAREGARVALVDVFEDRAAKTLAMIEEEGGEATVIGADLTDIPSCDRVVADTIATYGGVDILVNSAAMTLSASLVDTSVEQYERMLATNLTAPYMLCRAAIPSMVERGGGSIVNISSIASLRGQGGPCTAYSTSKSGLMGLMNDIADSYGKHGIRINCVAPGIIRTPQRDNVIIRHGGDPAAFDLSQKTCLGIEGEPWDIANAVLFLVSPEGHYITGVMLPVDGGAIARSH
jgi:NAD(P)-dependent dehydrogenase (short-subunit alcohol dehydrogenase family)